MGVASSPTATEKRVVTVNGANKSPTNDIEGGAATLKGLEIDATANPNEDVYVRIYDHLTPTVGTTLERMGFKGVAGVITPCHFPKGYTFATGISIACTQEKPGDVSGTGTDTTGTVDVNLIF